jgi:hypothetical protein
MNEHRMRPYGADEVKKAMFSIGDLKAPGGDVLHAVLFKKCWDFLGATLTKEVLYAINEKVIPDWNDTMIVLIPTVLSPEKISQYRLISLCNVLYKVISKMIAFCLKHILDEVISPAQSLFVVDRLRLCLVELLEPTFGFSSTRTN